MRAALPFGLWVPVLPGTRQVTIGGAIACDIHGKNHHSAGSFGNHVRSMDLLTADGEVRTLTPDGRRGRAVLGDRRRQRADRHHPARHHRDDPDRDGVLHRRRRRHRRPSTRPSPSTATAARPTTPTPAPGSTRSARRRSWAAPRSPAARWPRSTSCPTKLQKNPLKFDAPQLLTFPDVFPERAGQQVHLRADRRAVVPQVGHLPRQGPEPDAVLPPARHVRGVEPRLRSSGFRAVPVRGADRGGRGVQAHHRRHPALRALLVPQRVQALRPGQPSAAELPDPRLERLRRLPDQGRASTSSSPSSTAACSNSAAGSTPPRTPAPPPRPSTPCTRASTSGSRCAARSIPTACSPPTWPDVWSLL